VALIVVGLRLAAALLLSHAPIVLHPVLGDAAYQQAALSESASGSLPHGSVLYPLLVRLAPGLEQGGSRPLAILQSIIEGVAAVLLMLLVRRHWGGRAAVVAVVLYALDPLGGFFAARYTPVTFATLALAAALWLWDKERQRPGIGLGLAFSACVLFGFLLQSLPFLALAALWAWDHLRSPQGRRAFGTALVPVLVCLVAGGGLMARHGSIDGGAFVLNWGAGPSIDRAFDPASGGTPRALKPPAWRDEISLQTATWEALGREGGWGDVARFHASRGFRRAVENPVSTIGVLLTKAAGTIGAFPIPDDLAPVFLLTRHAPVFGYAAVSFAALFGLGLAGLVWRRRDPLTRLLSLGLTAVALACLIGPTSAASRQAALPLLAALGGAWLAGLRSGLEEPAEDASRRSRLRTSLVALAAGILLSLGAGWISPTSALRDTSEDLRLTASSFLQTQSVRPAVPLLEAAVRTNPSNLEARVALAQAYQRDALLGAAEEQLRAAFAIDSTHAGTLFTLASLHQARQEHDQARELMWRLARQRPTNPLYLNELGQLLIRSGDMARAQTVLARALRLKPDYAVAQRNLETVVEFQRHMEDALIPPGMRLAEDDSMMVTIDLASSALEQQDWPRADSLLRVAEGLRPDHVQPHWLRAAYHARREEFDQAIAALETCRRLAPGRPMIVDQLARLYTATGRTGSLDPLFRESLAAARGDSARVQGIEAVMRRASSGAPAGSPVAPGQ